MVYNDIRKNKGPDIANLFSEFFSSVYSTSQIDINNYKICMSELVDIPHLQLSVSDIYLELDNLSSKPKPGPDGIPDIMLKSCKCALSIPITFIFNLSLTSSQFPSRWKHSYVIPIFKAGLKESVINYRPISISTLFS